MTVTVVAVTVASSEVVGEVAEGEGLSVTEFGVVEISSAKAKLEAIIQTNESRVSDGTPIQNFFIFIRKIITDLS